MKNRTQLFGTWLCVEMHAAGNVETIDRDEAMRLTLEMDGTGHQSQNDEDDDFSWETDAEVSKLRLVLDEEISMEFAISSLEAESMILKLTTTEGEVEMHYVRAGQKMDLSALFNN